MIYVPLSVIIPRHSWFKLSFQMANKFIKSISNDIFPMFPLFAFLQALAYVTRNPSAHFSFRIRFCFYLCFLQGLLDAIWVFHSPLLMRMTPSFSVVLKPIFKP